MTAIGNRMVLRLQHRDKYSLELELLDEDISVAGILQLELLKDKDVVFAGVVTPHPLEKKAVLKIKTDGADALTALKRASEKSLTKIKEIMGYLEDESEGD